MPDSIFGAYPMRNIPVSAILKQTICWILFLQMINVSTRHPDQQNFRDRSVGAASFSLKSIESSFELLRDCLSGQVIPEDYEDDSDSLPETFDMYIFASVNPTRLVIHHFPLEHRSLYLDKFSEYLAAPNFPPPKQA